eukprot:scaffold157351_cov33-Tisochrysis_lutea.AAC.1
MRWSSWGRSGCIRQIGGGRRRRCQLLAEREHAVPALAHLLDRAIVASINRLRPRGGEARECVQLIELGSDPKMRIARPHLGQLVEQCVQLLLKRVLLEVALERRLA